MIRLLVNLSQESTINWSDSSPEIWLSFDKQPITSRHPNTGDPILDSSGQQETLEGLYTMTPSVSTSPTEEDSEPSGATLFVNDRDVSFLLHKPSSGKGGYWVTTVEAHTSQKLGPADFLFFEGDSKEPKKELYLHQLMRMQTLIYGLKTGSYSTSGGNSPGTAGNLMVGNRIDEQDRRGRNNAFYWRTGENAAPPLLTDQERSYEIVPFDPNKRGIYQREVPANLAEPTEELHPDSNADCTIQ